MDISKVLRGHSHSHCFTSCQVLSSPLTVSRYDLWPAKAEVLTTWPFVERAYSRELGPAESEFLGVLEAFLKEPGDPGLCSTDSGVKVDLWAFHLIHLTSRSSVSLCVLSQSPLDSTQILVRHRCVQGLDVHRDGRRSRSWDGGCLPPKHKFKVYLKDKWRLWFLVQLAQCEHSWLLCYHVWRLF